MTAGLREGSEEGLIAYVIAMAFHFVALRHSLRDEYPVPYQRNGGWVLGLMCLAGAGLGTVVNLPLAVEALLLVFLGGMLIMDITVMELPSEKEGRFGWFVAGSVRGGLSWLHQEGMKPVEAARQPPRNDSIGSTAEARRAGR